MWIHQEIHKMWSLRLNVFICKPILCPFSWYSCWNFVWLLWQWWKTCTALLQNSSLGLRPYTLIREVLPPKSTRKNKVKICWSQRFILIAHGFYPKGTTNGQMNMFSHLYLETDFILLILPIILACQPKQILFHYLNILIINSFSISNFSNEVFHFLSPSP